MAKKKRGAKKASQKRRRPPFADMAPIVLPDGEVLDPADVFRQLHDMMQRMPTPIDLCAGRDRTDAERACAEAEEMLAEASNS